MTQTPIRLNLRASGPLACFTRPECGIERVSYPWITPSAARAIFEAVLWKPRIRYEVREIRILKPIRFQSIRRNEISGNIALKAAEIDDRLLCDQNRQQRNTLALAEVDYVLSADLFLRDDLRERSDEIDDANQPLFKIGSPDNHGKYRAMFERRLSKGQCFHRPYLGCREFAADVRPVEGTELPLPIDMDHGTMLYDLVYPVTDEDRQRDGGHRWRNGMATPLTFCATMRQGIVAVPSRNDIERARP